MKLKRQSAFTFIELLIVVTIIAPLSAVLALDFRTARESQAVASLTDQAVALLQQAQLEVRSGHVDIEDEESADDEQDILQDWICQGGFFAIGTSPLYAQSEFSLDDETCQEPVFESYGLSSTGAAILGIQVADIDYEGLVLLFEPPNGDVIMWGRFEDEEDFNELNGTARIKVGHQSNEDIAQTIEINYLTSSVRILSDEDHEKQ